jgi:hypothetical protein
MYNAKKGKNEKRVETSIISEGMRRIDLLLSLGG